MAFPRLTEESIIDRLSLARKRPLDNPYPADLLSGTPQPAAVLIPFLQFDNAWHLLYIRRTEKAEDRHGGQVAFPGGRADPTDVDPVHTALREAQEEIGLNPAHVRVLGRLNDILTITNYRVTPVVGVIPWPYPIELQSSEVSRAFTIPLDWLADRTNYDVKTRTLPDPFEPLQVIYFKPYDQELLWGASARITQILLQALNQQPPPTN